MRNIGSAVGKTGLVKGLALLVVIGAATAVGCSAEQAEEETASSEGALRQECSLSAIEDANDLLLEATRIPGDRFACKVHFEATIVQPLRCTREYTVTLYNGDGTHIIDRDRCRNCSARGAPDTYPSAGDPAVLRIPRGSTACRIGKFEEEFSSNDRVKRLCFTCPVECSAPDHC